MCGIIGYIGSEQAAPIMLKGLAQLEYRGYDSAGMASINNFGKLELRRQVGKVCELKNLHDHLPLYGRIGIGHTRWATHGGVEERNAHPQQSGKVAVVHNGVIENYKELRAELEREGCRFISDTDTELIPQLIDLYLSGGTHYCEAVRRTVKKLQGSFAFVALLEDYPNMLICACRNQSFVIGSNAQEIVVASDESALPQSIEWVVHLEDRDIAVIARGARVFFDDDGGDVLRPAQPIASIERVADKGDHRWFTEKEIFEQPVSIERALSVKIPKLPIDLSKLTRLWLIGCGTAYHAGLVVRDLFEAQYQIPVCCEIASEYMHRELFSGSDEVGIFISQSGETADTIAALRRMKEAGCRTIAVVNREGSMMARLADVVIPIDAGLEVGVASTKAFTSQVAVLTRLASGVCGRTVDRINDIKQALALSQAIREIAEKLRGVDNMLYIGRGRSYAVCLEGALKMKELSYVHAEALAAGELKHGSLALVGNKTLVVAVAPPNRWFAKTANSIEEVVARDGKVLLFSDEEGCASLAGSVWQSVSVPARDPRLGIPLAYSVALQLLAYHVAVERGVDIDRPRHLAKSVTVE